MAFEYALQYNHRLYSLKIGYDAEKFRDFSVGRQVVDMSLQRCFDEGLDEYDFLGPLTATHAEWKPETRPIGQIHLYRSTVLGRLQFASRFFIRPLAKRLLRRCQAAEQR